MLSFTITNNHIPRSLYTFPRMNYPFIPCSISVRNPTRKSKIAVFPSSSFGFLQVIKKFEGNFYANTSSWGCCCSSSSKDSEWDFELEAEIMGFMEKSEKPTMFPTKKDLIRAGRLDLVEAIKRKGGWYSFGWDDEHNVEEEVIEEEFRIGNENNSFGENRNDNSLFGREIKDERFPSSENSNSFQAQLPSSLDISLEKGCDEDAGIDGILSRLEKQRNIDLGLNLGKYQSKTRARIKDVEHNRHFDTSKETEAKFDLGENNRLMPSSQREGTMNTPDDKIRHYTEPETWNTWMNQRAGYHQLKEFEAAEISYNKDNETHYDGISVITEEINPNQIRTRLKHLDSELNTALRALRSKKEELFSEKVVRSSSNLQKLTDAWELQENEFMNAQDRLRSIKAKLSVLDGKIALATIDAQKGLEEKQKRIDGARKALQLLRTTLIVWHNSASEVSLVGSFDGWTTQRRMEKSRTGIFSVWLKLYPGRYEIKFIVDGVWKVDPLRPIVNNNGHENNLFIVA